MVILLIFYLLTSTNTMSFNSGPCNGECKGGTTWLHHGERLVCSCSDECQCRNLRFYSWRHGGAEMSFMGRCLIKDNNSNLPSQSPSTAMTVKKIVIK
jgi:hypothetical protein